MVQAVNPYINFAGNTLEAFEFYRSVFGGEFPMVLRFRDFPGNMGAPEEAVQAEARAHGVHGEFFFVCHGHNQGL